MPEQKWFIILNWQYASLHWFPQKLSSPPLSVSSSLDLSHSNELFLCSVFCFSRLLSLSLSVSRSVFFPPFVLLCFPFIVTNALSRCQGSFKYLGWEWEYIRREILIFILLAEVLRSVILHRPKSTVLDMMDSTP